MTEPTNAELIAIAAGITLGIRQVVEDMAQNNRPEERQALETMSETVAISGGAMMVLAQRLGCESEVQALIDEAQSRAQSMRACSGLEGSA
jgi:hypothetical protein